MRRLIRSAALVLLAAWMSGCAVNPVTGRREISLVSGDQELAIGREGFKAVVEEYGAYDDSLLARYVEGVGRKLARVSHLPALDWHFTVLDDPVVNAFAMPGGYIYITRGILAHLNSEAQLAGVLGHEIGHVTARHSAQQITQQQLAGLGLGLASLVSDSFKRYSSLAEQGLGLLFLKYGRDDETQADELGVDYSVTAGYDPREIPKTYTMLGRVSAAAGQRLPFYLSTHPDPGNRQVHTTQLSTAAAAGKTGLVVNAGGHLERLNGLVFGHDPRQGYFEGEHYYHPALRFEIVFPAGWRTRDTRAAVMAAAPGDRAQMELAPARAGSLGPSDYVADLQRRGAISATAGRRESIGGFEAWVGRLEVTAQDGRRAQFASAFIRRGPGEMYQVLGRAAAAGGDDEARILAAARSFRALSDPARLEARPDRVRLQRVAAAGSFRTVVPKLGPQAIGIEPSSILNNRLPDDPVAEGETLKIVAPGKAR